MATVTRTARPRRSPNRIRLVELDGTPVVRPTKDHALSWAPSADSWFYECGESAHDLAAHVHIDPPEPDAPDGESGWAHLMVEASLPRIPGIDPEPEAETDAEFLARLHAEEAAERRRIETTYFPTVSDLAEYDEWLASLDDGRPVEVRELFHTIEEWDAIRRNQVTDDELSQLAAHGAI